MILELNNQINLTNSKNTFCQSNEGLTVCDLCSCNPRNGGSGICGCTIANNPVDYNHTQYEYLTDINVLNENNGKR